ncbi:hypothetical protein [Flavobacterium urocaniciphilum]|uniref:DUF3299 domain-containing protein n=1 Tax=Flavobacterium urocaniciphilum TaxID=1299341 RepID=A0A1H9C7J3_9FLAO|nr:hypothetical protein [Flavobacterium urocaniciphilum]SEP96773.1 hypothetical protein SAMN05444005_10471 [Flavobacterium urocaniciphilum]
MHNSTKLVIALLVGVFLFSFKNQNEVAAYNTSKSVVAADTLTWKMLGEIKFMKKKHASYGEVDFPIINTKLKKLAKKTIVMSGFIVPIDNKNYALSKNVFASCFFCGKSGPETIMGIKFKGATPKLKTDTYLTIKGTFRPNETDVEDWIYNCDNAEIVKGK